MPTASLFLFLIVLAAWQLHCGAMERSVLPDQGAAIDRYDLVVGHGSLYYPECMHILIGLHVYRNEDNLIEYQEVCVRCRQP